MVVRCICCSLFGVSCCFETHKLRQECPNYDGRWMVNLYSLGYAKQRLKINYYITIYIFVYFIFNYLSALVGCWSSVPLRKIIYNFLNVCPFDHTAFMVSGIWIRVNCPQGVFVIGLVRFLPFSLLCVAKDHWRGFSTRNAHMVHFCTYGLQILLNLTEIVILWVYYTIQFSLSLIWHLWGITFQLFELLCLARNHWRGFSTRNAHIVHFVN